jgi:hypothetical protein
MNLLIEELNWSREERLRLERVAVGRICGCKSCLCCEELKRDTEQRKAVRELVLLKGNGDD